MILPSSKPGEPLMAEGAFVWFFTRVAPFMWQNGSGMGKLFVAKPARIRLLVSVGPDVRTQLLSVRKPLVTKGTLVVFLAGVDQVVQVPGVLRP